eukprot:COSAG04_NODE_18821_length_431_cov_10.560241_1_plen_122_part_00
MPACRSGKASCRLLDRWFRVTDAADHSSVESSRIYTVDTLQMRASNSTLVASAFVHRMQQACVHTADCIRHTGPAALSSGCWEHRLAALLRGGAVAVRRRPPRSETPHLAKAFTVGRAVSA